MENQKNGSGISGSIAKDNRTEEEMKRDEATSMQEAILKDEKELNDFIEKNPEMAFIKNELGHTRFSNMGWHALREMKILNDFFPNPENPAIIKDYTKEIFALVNKVGISGQSGGSIDIVAGCIADTLKKLLTFGVITQISGHEHEWNDVSKMNNGQILFQNNRASGIFKNEPDGKARYVDAIIFKTPGGTQYHSSAGAFLPDGSRVGSCQGIKSFPFLPKTFYVDVLEREIAPDDWQFYLEDESQFEAVWKYYDRI